ncbi:MAG: CPBP family glutamic-type intramembrane protease [Peptoniphilaceae bacterium]
MEKDLIKIKDYTDFPFENISNTRWILSMLLLFGGFLLTTITNLENPLISYGIFIVSSISSLFILDKKWLKKLIKPLEIKDLFIIIFVLFSTYFIGILVSILVSKTSMVENPITGVINNDNILKLFIIMIVQLFVEEILFVLPFLFIFNKFKYYNRIMAIIAAWIISSIIFGALHLPTYNYNLFQSLVVISLIRFAISSAYVWRKNLALSYLIHVIYDFLILILVLYLKNSGIF